MNTPVLERDFELDAFQLEAIAAIDGGSSVLVTAPTGAGKTVVAEHAIAKALDSGARAFYTTPIKALSNQKFHDLSALYGADNLGLLTGDVAVRPEAPVVVMTTEVLRNMVYRQREGVSGPLDNLDWVILDEVHYIADPERGPVWEEVIIGLPKAARLVCLSATISNAGEVGRWLQTVRGPTEVIEHRKRTVPLTDYMLVKDGEKKGDQLVLTSLFNGNGKPNPAGRIYDSNPFIYDDDDDDDDDDDWDDDWWGGGWKEWRFHTPEPPQVLKVLRERDMLPAVYFIFSRKGCDKAARMMGGATPYTTPEETEQIDRIAARYLDGLAESDLESLGAKAWLHGVRRGIAAHHAGMPPVFKEVVEECFIAGLVKVVFATETLSVGMNMPAKTAVLDRLSKFDGVGHSPLTSLQYTQLTGRAGRRGIDTEGNAVVLWSPYEGFSEAASIASAASAPLHSAFTPSYNTVASLASRFDREDAISFISKSYAQFLADEQSAAAVTAIENAKTREEKIAREQREKAVVKPEKEATEQKGSSEREDELGIASYLDQLEKLPNIARHLKRGDVIDWTATRKGPCVPEAVMLFTKGKLDPIRVKTITADGDIKSWAYGTLRGAQRVGHIDVSDLPEHAGWRSEETIETVMKRMSSAGITPAEQTELALDPAAGDPRIEECLARRQKENRRQQIAQQKEARSREQALKGEKKRERRRARAASAAAQEQRRLAGLVDSLSNVLQDRGHLDSEWNLTETGEVVAKIHHESDLLAAEVITEGLLDGLDQGDLAAAVSTLCYDPRKDDPIHCDNYPEGPLEERIGQMLALRKDIRDTENKHISTELNGRESVCSGFVPLAYAWTQGAELGTVLVGGWTPGDFIRTARRTADLLRQIAASAPSEELAKAAREAAQRMARGVVAETRIAETASWPG